MWKNNCIYRILFFGALIFLISSSANASLVRIDVTNNTNMVWGDFHIELYPAAGSDISNVMFLDNSFVAGTDPESSQSPYSWSIDNINKTLDLAFYNDPLYIGEEGCFIYHIDNPDAVQFSTALYPTPLPLPVAEPPTVLLLGISLIGLGVFRDKFQK